MQQETDQRQLPQPQADSNIYGKNIFVCFFGDITPQSVQNITRVFLELSGHRPASISFLFSSRGGDVSAGITLHNFLRSLSIDLILFNMGSIDSIATVIFLSGEERYACPHSTFLFHGTALNISGNHSIRLNQLRELESQIQKDEEKIAGIVAKHTNIGLEEIKEFFNQGVSKDLQFAKEKGLIKDIKSPSIGDSFCVNVLP